MTSMRRLAATAAILFLGGAGLAPPLAAAKDRPAATRATPHTAAQARPQRGQASYYAPKFNGRRMANGARFDPNGQNAAHRSLPLGTTAKVTNLENGRTAEVKVEDRGPYVGGRIMDVSPKTAGQLDMRKDGTAPVVVEPVRVPEKDERVVAR